MCVRTYVCMYICLPLDIKSALALTCRNKSKGPVCEGFAEVSEPTRDANGEETASATPEEPAPGLLLLFGMLILFGMCSTRADEERDMTGRAEAGR